MYPTVPAERYFAGSAALPAAQACQHDDAPALNKALADSGVSPDAVGQQGMSLLLLAMSNRSLQATAELLRRGANPNLRTRLGAQYTEVQPVALAAGGDNTPLLKLLLIHGGNPNSRYGANPATFVAADANRTDHLRLLLDHGADLNATGDHGATLLLHLAEQREFEQVAYLVERGADVHKADNTGGTVAFEVQEARPTLPEARKPWGERVQQLLEKKGITFPVPDPSVAFQARVRQENAQRRLWETTPEGQRYHNQVAAANRQREQEQAGNPNAGGAAYNQAQQLRAEAEPRFQAWRKTQPHWQPSTNDGTVTLYPDPVPTLAQDAADSARQAAATRRSEPDFRPR
ncbi:ankyrin repeat domain-containing protein [Hymenobacter arcticus]